MSGNVVPPRFPWVPLRPLGSHLKNWHKGLQQQQLFYRNQHLPVANDSSVQPF